MPVTFSQSKFKRFLLWNNSPIKESLFYMNSICAKNCPYYLEADQSHLIPFQVELPTSAQQNVEEFTLVAIDGSCEFPINNVYVTNGNDAQHINFLTINNVTTAFYNGTTIDNLPCGVFTMRLKLNGIYYYFEPIKISNILGYNDLSRALLHEDGVSFSLEDGSGLILLED
jgi:hypothetical protein